jgi:broad specificity phosphatase PhoE
MMKVLLTAMFLALSGVEQAQSSMIILVRHAEAVPDAGNDPVLSEAGIARARALAAALKDAGVKAVITTQYQRTILTGRPLAEATGAELINLSAQTELDTAALGAKYSGGVIVIVGHSNTVPAIVKGLTGVDVEIAHDSFDQMFIVTRNAGSARLVRARY